MYSYDDQSFQSPVMLDLCLRRTRSGKSRDYCDVIVVKSSVFKMVRLDTLHLLHNEVCLENSG